jgi:endonuclease/exonuclease/phosphatase family metal-dependent hydrolase
VKKLTKILILLLIVPSIAFSYTFRITNYNVENLFDLKRDIGEYREYIPNSNANWNKDTQDKKLENIKKVLLDIDSEIVALQEVESPTALADLKNKVKIYPYMAISNGKDSTVSCAVLSKFKITKVNELEVSRHPLVRNILEVHIDVKGKTIIVFVNHWKAKTGAESKRIEFARTLKSRIKELPKNSDFVILGDLNSNYDEFQTFKNDRKLNNTSGKTGINDILKTNYNGKVISQDEFYKLDNNYLLNLWTELDNSNRFSSFFNGKKTTLDNIIVPQSLFDSEGISYKDDSFKVFKPEYLFKSKKRLYRWEKIKGKFTGRGFSDHLPVYAEFTTEPFAGKDKNDVREIRNINSLYNEKVGRKNFVVRSAVVIHKDKKGAILKQEDSKGIYVYGPKHNFVLQGIYDFGVREINDFFGKREVVRADKVVKVGDIKKREYDKLFIYNTNQDFNHLKHQNEVITKISGEYKDGFLYYNGHKIKLYFVDKSKKPKMNGPITLNNVVVGFYKNPQLVVY